VTAPAEATELNVETAPLARMGADLLQLDIEPGSGRRTVELRLPVERSSR
jgi:cell volume regulation protein A